jgi:hypothetical protein
MQVDRSGTRMSADPEHHLWIGSARDVEDA